MKSVGIIGGGISGIATAVFLCKKFDVTLIESTNYLGGRARSYLNIPMNSYYDNGQHLLAGAYINTIEFLSEIDALNNFSFQENLTINYLQKNKKLVKFQIDKSNSDLKKAIGLLKLTTIPIWDRIKVLNFLKKLNTLNSDEYITHSVRDILIDFSQTEEAIEKLWKVIVVSTLNCSIEKASAKIFIDMIKKLFFSEPKNSVLIFPKRELYHSYIEPATKYISQNGVKILLNTFINKIIENDKRIESIKTIKSEFNFDFYVLATASYGLKNILDKNDNVFFSRSGELKYNPIISINIWFKDFAPKEKFYYLIGSPLQWLFIKDSYVSIVISDAEEYIYYSKDKMISIALSELKEYFDYDFISNMISYKIIKEKRATFIPDEISYKIRPEQKSEFQNLFLVGDYTKTGLPSTIESAVMSAKICSDLILKKY